jgi:hypothetical protein
MWTAKTPKKPGYYWFRRNNFTQIVLVTGNLISGKEELEMPIDFRTFDIDNNLSPSLVGKWLGPLEIPK